MIDDLSEEVPLDRAPERIVSLVPSLTEAVEVSAPGRLVGATDYCTHPFTLDVQRVGGSKYPRMQDVLALTPDLVVANTEENRRDDVDHLRANGVPVWVMREAATVPSALASIRRLLTQGLDVREPEWLCEAEELWAAVEAPRRRAVVPVWRKPWVVVGRDTFAGDVLRRLGVINVYAGHTERYPRPTLADLRKRFDDGDADLLVLPDEPWKFTADDGPDAFPGVPYALVNGRHLTWYGPSLVNAHRILRQALP